MDVICLCCGEPWDVYYVLHDEPDGFDRNGCVIDSCPCCHGGRPDDLPQHQRQWLESVRAMAELLGDDIDAILALSGNSDLYNNSGDDEPIGISGSADPFANNDDPSDPSD